MPVQKVCGHCATSFQVPVRRHETVKFCSVGCKNNAKRCTLICATCGNSFERKKHDDFAKYCSNACYHSSRVGVARKVKNPHRHLRTCEVCAIEFRVMLARKDTARWCSRACQSKSNAFRSEMSETQKGEKGWRWSGGRYQFRSGYVRARGAGLNSKRTNFEHRVVIERAMVEAEPNHPFLIEVDGAKKLDPKIEVHHIDLDRTHNEFSNLLAVTKQAHARIHHRNMKPEAWECWPHSHIMNNCKEQIPYA